MPSEVSVANRALALVGEAPIVSFADASKAARTVNACYEDIRDEVLRDHPWNSAKARAQLAALATAPLFGWDLAYAWPADALRILRVNDELWDGATGWEVEGRNILTDWLAPIDVEYVRKETDPNVWDPMLRSAIVLRLAAEICEPITHDEAKAARLTQGYERMKVRAAITDGLEEEVVEDDFDDTWVNARLR